QPRLRGFCTGMELFVERILDVLAGLLQVSFGLIVLAFGLGLLVIGGVAHGLFGLAGQTFGGVLRFVSHTHEDDPLRVVAPLHRGRRSTCRRFVSADARRTASSAPSTGLAPT